MHDSKVVTYASARLKPYCSTPQSFVKVKPAEGDTAPSVPNRNSELKVLPLVLAQSLVGYSGTADCVRVVEKDGVADTEGMFVLLVPVSTVNWEERNSFLRRNTLGLMSASHSA